MRVCGRRRHAFDSDCQICLRAIGKFALGYVSFGRLLPLHLPSPFGDKDMIQKLMAYSGGLTGRMTTLLAQAAELAIRQKTECISLDLLDKAASAGIFRIPVEEEADDALA